jgi:apolipoprotein N-acyltransferase
VSVRETRGSAVVNAATKGGWIAPKNRSSSRASATTGADVMLVPSNDWPEIDPIHTQAITFRAIENGYSLVRQTSYGLAMTVDYEGNVLAAVDD